MFNKNSLEFYYNKRIKCGVRSLFLGKIRITSHLLTNIGSFQVNSITLFINHPQINLSIHEFNQKISNLIQSYVIDIKIADFIFQDQRSQETNVLVMNFLV